MDGYPGVDIGSVTTRCTVIPEGGELIAYNYLCIQGKPVPLESRDSWEFRDNSPLMSGSVVDTSKYSPLESGPYFERGG